MPTDPRNGSPQAYLHQLQTNPLRTKMLTSGVLSGLQELLASWIAHDVGKHGHYFSSRVPKMSLYGMFISAPLGHLLIGILQKIFAGRTSLKAKILQILVSNLIVRAFHGSRVQTDSPFSPGLAHPEHRLPVLDGGHRGRAHHSPGPRHRPRGIHARHEGQLDHLADCPGLCPVLPS